MPPSQVAVRPVDPADTQDVDSLAQLWIAARPTHRQSADVGEVRSSLASALGRGCVEVFLARTDGQDVGFLVMTRGPLLPLIDEPSVAIEHLFVVEEARRRGAGRALIARATSSAEQSGAGQISTNVPALGRESQRFFARLGFSPFVVRRVASVPALRRRLTPDDCPATDPTLLRRRSLRARSRAVALRARSTA